MCCCWPGCSVQLESAGPLKRGTPTLAETEPVYGTPAGRVAVFGDSDCVDDNHVLGTCWWLLARLMRYASVVLCVAPTMLSCLI